MSQGNEKAHLSDGPSALALLSKDSKPSDHLANANNETSGSTSVPSLFANTVSNSISLGVTKKEPSPLPTEIVKCTSTLVPPRASNSVLASSIEVRQQELQQAVQLQIQYLEQCVTQREEELAAVQTQYRLLEEDYRFNLSLIRERDEALNDAAKDLNDIFRDCSQLKREKEEYRVALESAQQECHILRETVQRLESELEGERGRSSSQGAVKERFYADRIRELQQQYESKAEQQHAHYLALVAEVEEKRKWIDTSATERIEAAVAQHNAWKEEQLQLMRQSNEEKERVEKAHQALKNEYDVLQRELKLQQERHEVALEMLRKGKAQERDKLLAEVDEKIGVVEASLRSAIASRQKAEEERDSLTRRNKDLESQIMDILDARSTSDAQYKERIVQLESDLRKASDELQISEVARLSAERSRKSDLLGVEEELGFVRNEAQRYKIEVESLRAAREEAAEKLAVTLRDVQRLQAEVEQWKEEEKRTAERGKESLRRTTERLEEYEETVRHLNEELRASQSRFRDISENTQMETSRLRQDLHASETARFALEEQLQLIKDHDKTQILLNTMRGEKELLAKRVVELEHINAEVRQQVSAFTMELQNDPILKNAKEQASRIPELQQQLLEAQATQQMLQRTINERDDELKKLKLEHHLRHHSADGSDASRRLALEYADLQREYEVLRDLYEKLRVERERGRLSNERSDAFKSHRPRASISPSSASSSSSSPPSLQNPPTPGGSTQKGSGRGLWTHRSRQHYSRSRSSTPPQVERHRDRGGKRNYRRSPANSSQEYPYIPPQGRVTDALLHDHYASSESTTVWRRRCLELEQHLQQALSERDEARRQVAVEQQEKAALSRQVRSLTELNSFLKAQWREHQQQSLKPSQGSAALSPAAASLTPAEVSTVASLLRLLTNSNSLPTQIDGGPTKNSGGPAGVPETDIAERTERARVAAPKRNGVAFSQLPSTRLYAEHSDPAATSKKGTGIRTSAQKLPGSQVLRGERGNSTAPSTNSHQVVAKREGYGAVRNYTIDH